MKYAVVRTGGKQYRVAEGDSVRVERIDQDANSEFVFSEVLMINDEGKVTLGTPLVSDVPVKGVLVNHLRGEKIRVSKFKSKVRFRKVTGHRQALSEIKVTTIGTGNTAKSEEKEVKVAKPKSKKTEVK